MIIFIVAARKQSPEILARRKVRRWHADRPERRLQPVLDGLLRARRESAHLARDRSTGRPRAAVQPGVKVENGGLGPDTNSKLPVRFRVGGINKDGPESRGLSERCLMGYSSGRRSCRACPTTSSGASRPGRTP
jgi:hypothetical protein